MVAFEGTFSLSVPFPVPVLTVTVREAPEPAVLVIDAPDIRVVVRLKSAVEVPLTVSEKVTRKMTVVGRGGPKGEESVIEMTEGPEAWVVNDQ